MSTLNRYMFKLVRRLGSPLVQNMGPQFATLPSSSLPGWDFNLKYRPLGGKLRNTRVRSFRCVYMGWTGSYRQSTGTCQRQPLKSHCILPPVALDNRNNNASISLLVEKCLVAPQVPLSVIQACTVAKFWKHNPCP